MEGLIIDDRTSPDQIIRAAVDRRHVTDRRSNPYSGMIGREFERRQGIKNRRIVVRRKEANPESITVGMSGASTDDTLS